MLDITRADGFAERMLINQIKSRSGETDRKVSAAVSEIIYAVRMGGDEAVREYTEKFDGAVPEKTEIGREEMETALKNSSSDFVYALHKAAENIRDFHERQKQQSWFNTFENGTMVGQRIRGLERVGVYVPGGTAAYRPHRH